MVCYNVLNLILISALTFRVFELLIKTRNPDLSIFRIFYHNNFFLCINFIDKMKHLKVKNKKAANF